ncbi:helix-turn-helix domain-containing protein [Flavobacterium sp. HJSW_4]|uniref:helix-turn-helix domain-containing protein n=1 Tax=Flavobacterium sp. HJSW_4 TaxID=3344660 RepID=UPI0035F39174
MITIEHSFGADLNWIASYAEQLEGKIEGNSILIPEKIGSGVRYFLDCGHDIVLLYIDAVYNTDIKFIQKNTTTDFIGFYYDLTDGEAQKRSSNFFYNVGRFGYNLSIIDSILDTSYEVKAGSKTMALCIFIKKIKIKSFAENNPVFLENMDKIMDSSKNTFIKFDRISVNSSIILKDLQKMEVSGSVFNLSLISAAHMLVSDYLIQMVNNNIVIEKVDQKDFLSIIDIQHYLMDNISGVFPSIKHIAEKSNMSESKFKKLFSKMTGTPANSFFMNYKLLKAKELLEQKMSISEVTDELNFTDYAYFIFRFKKHFGVSPLTFVKGL